jgi:hypothetical protein
MPERPTLLAIGDKEGACLQGESCADAYEPAEEVFDAPTISSNTEAIGDDAATNSFSINAIDNKTSLVMKGRYATGNLW